MNPPVFLIVGAGLAGAKAAEALREEGFDGRVVLLGAEAHRPYERPPLSAGYLQGASQLAEAFVHPAAWYEDHDVELRLNTAVSRLECSAHEVELADGTRLGYDKLLLATGAEPRRLRLPGADRAPLHYLRTIEDSDRLKSAFAAGTRVAVVGGGWIGLETAAAARQAGAEVTVIEQADLPLVRVLGPEVARVFADLHRDHGVDLRLGARLREVGEKGELVFEDGDTVDGDVVVVGVGVAPRVELAQAAGLAVEDGIVVDEHLQTSDPDVYAAGDVANAYHPRLCRQVRVEHWANALHQPALAARSMLGRPASYDRLPYFFTDQYDLGMEYIGYAAPGGYDRVVIRGDLSDREFIACWLLDGRLVAGMNVNVWDVVEPITQLIESGRQLDPERLADVDVPLEELTG